MPSNVPAPPILAIAVSVVAMLQLGPELLVQMVAGEEQESISIYREEIFPCYTIR